MQMRMRVELNVVFSISIKRLTYGSIQKSEENFQPPHSCKSSEKLSTKAENYEVIDRVSPYTGMSNRIIPNLEYYFISSASYADLITAMFTKPGKMHKVPNKIPGKFTNHKKKLKLSKLGVVNTRLVRLLTFNYAYFRYNCHSAKSTCTHLCKNKFQNYFLKQYSSTNIVFFCFSAMYGKIFPQNTRFVPLRLLT